MKFIKYFILVTFIITIFGCLVLINDGEFDIYAFWNTTALGAAVYYIFKK